MEYWLVCSVALAASCLTFFSGFGLGTLLLPAFAVFFPVPVAIAMTALVHLANNLFKLGLMGRYANGKTLLRFGITAVPAAFLGAWWLNHLEALPPLLRYTLAGSTHDVTPVNLCIALLLAVFAVLEILPAFSNLALPPKFLPLGGALSGFFGGLSGQQGALRSAFLLRAGLSKQAFIGTGVALACLVDLTRIPLYARHFSAMGSNAGLLTAAVLSAWIGAFLGARLFPKATYRSLQILVAVLLLFLAVLIGSGIL
jgi:uncharacterized membrane protein YfcA